MTTRKIDLTGLRFGRLVVVALCDKRGGRQLRWACQCDCGKTTESQGGQLRKGLTQSCGCLRVERFRKHATKYADPKEASWVLYERKYMEGAKTRNHPWEISTDIFRHICGLNCSYCGEPPRRWSGVRPRQVDSPRREEAMIRINGIDRIDNALGYVPGNLCTSCSTCNLMKGSMSVEKFITHVRKITARGNLNEYF